MSDEEGWAEKGRLSWGKKSMICYGISMKCHYNLSNIKNNRMHSMNDGLLRGDFVEKNPENLLFLAFICLIFAAFIYNILSKNSFDGI